MVILLLQNATLNTVNMKKIYSLIIILMTFVLSFDAAAQRTNIFTDKDGVTMCYSKPSVLILNLINHIQVEYRLACFTDRINQTQYAMVVISNYAGSKVSAGNNVMFRLSDGTVIKGVAKRSFGDADRVSAQNATSQAANQQYLQAYYQMSQKDIDKLMSGTIIKMRIEFENFNVDFDEKKCRTMSENIKQKYDEVRKAMNLNSSDF